MIMLSLY